MLTQILAILKGFFEVIGLVKEVIGLVRKAKKEGWIQDGRELSHAIKNAKTNEERRELVKRLSDHSSSSPS